MAKRNKILKEIDSSEPNHIVGRRKEKTFFSVHYYFILFNKEYCPARPKIQLGYQWMTERLPYIIYSEVAIQWQPNCIQRWRRLMSSSSTTPVKRNRRKEKEPKTGAIVLFVLQRRSLFGFDRFDR